jgi:hypothetical protein
MALVARSDYTVPREFMSSNLHQNSKVHSPKNFTAAAQLVDTPHPIHPSSSSQNQVPNFSAFDTKNSSTSLGNSNASMTNANTTTAAANNSRSNVQNQVPNFSAFDTKNSSTSLGNSNGSMTNANTTTAAANNSRSNVQAPDPSQLPFGFQNGLNSKSNIMTNPSSGDDNAVEGTRASHSAESLIGSIMSPRTLLSTAMNEIGNSTSNKESNKTEQVQLVTPHTSTILLSNQLIPSKDYLYLYDSIVNGNVTGNLVARLPCNSNMKSSVLILAGYLPRLKPISDQARPINEMSSPGLQCIYGLQISQDTLLPRTSTGNNTVLDLALYNPTQEPIRLPVGSSITVNLYDSSTAS